MKATHPVHKPVVLALFLAAACLMAACAQDSPTDLGSPSAPESASALFAAGGNGKGGGKGGGGGGGSGGGEVTVTSAIPSKVPQGVTANVRVIGTGFDSGSKVDILLNHKKTQKVTTNSTTFVDDTELIANITVDTNALLAKYDVRVTTSRKKKGIGIESGLLEVIPGPQADLPEVLLDNSGNILSGPGIYQDGGGTYLPTDGVSFNKSDNLRVQISCETGRAFKVVLPNPDPMVNPGWALSGPLAVPACGFIRLQIPGLIDADCLPPADLPPCSIGKDPEPPNYAPSVFFFFIVDSNGDGKRDPTKDDSYNIVWTDAEFEVLVRRPDGTPRVWRVTGGPNNAAVLYLRPGDQLDPPQPQGVSTAVVLDLTVTLIE